MSEKNIKSFIEELIDEVEKELEEANVTGNVDGYDTPFAFSDKNSDKKRKKTATQFGYTLVNNDINNIDESVNEAFKHIIHVDTPTQVVSKPIAAQILALAKKGVRSKEIGLEMGFVGNAKLAADAFQKVKNKIYFELDKRESVNESLDPKAQKFLDAIQVNDRSIKDLKNITVDATPQGNWSVYYKGKRMFTLNGKMLDDKTIMKYGLEHMDESLSEGKSKRPVNRWLELKNDESMHANKKLATGLRELKYQLKEVETFFRWYNQIKTMNELSSDGFWKRTHGHIYKIKERLINIAKTIQEIEK